MENRLREFLKEEQNRVLYRQWLKNPITEMVLDAGRITSRTPRVSYDKITADRASYILGMSQGQNMILDSIESAAEEMEAVPTDKIDWDWRSEMRNLGHSEKEITEMEE